MPKFTRSFITGSWAYGEPQTNHEMCFECNRDLPDTGSDVDLVVLVSKDDSDILLQECDDDGGTEYNEKCRSLRFGKLNLICLLTDDDFREWKIATRILKNIASLREDGIVTREEAIALMDRVRDPILNGIDYSLAFIKKVVRSRHARKQC